MENQGFYDLSNGSTPAAGRKNKGLYDFNDESEQTQSTAPRYTGNVNVDEWIHSLPEDQRAEAIKKVNEPLTGEEIATHIDRNPSFRFTNERDFLAYNDFRKNEDRSTIADLADGIANMTDLIGTAVSQIGEKPGNAAITAIPSIIEGSIQATRDTIGLAAQSTNPNSAVFRFRHAIFGTGTVADQMRQVNEALQFNERSNRLISGQDTIVFDKDLVNPGVTQMAAMLVDPVSLVPFGKASKLLGISNLATKGARAVGFGGTMIDASLRAQKIKTAVMSGALKWGVGMPLDAIGGAVRGTIDYSIDKFGKVVEFSTGVDAADISRATRLAGAGTATAGLAGMSVPYATSAATAYYAGSFAKGMGEAVALVSEQMRKQGGHRGLFSYATKALEETEALLAKSGGTLNPATKKMLKLIDKIDPLMSYASEATSGAIFGGAIGGVLGALNEGEKGFGFGMGMGAVGGVLGASTGRAFADISGATFRERLMVSSEFGRRLYHEKDPVSAIMLDRVIGDSRMNGETRRVLDLFSLALGKVDGLVSFRALSGAEYPHYLDTLNKAGLYDARQDPTPAKFREADGFSIRRNANGATEVVINTDKFFSKNEYGRHAVAHEFIHGFIMSSSLGENFKKMFRDTVLGFRDANGKIISKGIVPPSEFKEFVMNYFGQGIKGLSKDAALARRENMRTYEAILNKWESQGKAGAEPLNLEEMKLLENMTEEFGAYYFSAWFDEADAYFIESGGNLTGIRSVMDSLKNAWLDNIEDRINLHDTAFTFTRNRGKDLTSGFYRDGKRIRVGAMDYLIRDIYRLSSGLAAKGYIDLSGMTDSARKAFFERAGLDDVASKNKKGKWVPKNEAQSAAEAKVLGASAELVLEGLEPSARSSTKHADGVIRGPFSDTELNALVDAGLISEGLASKFKLLQAMSSDLSGYVPNVAEFGYVGKERGLSETNDNLRASGSDVPFTNRKVLVIDTIGEISKDGKFSWRIRALDLKVIERRMANKWSDARVRALFDNDLSLMQYEFYNVYLRNASLPTGHPDRKPSANLWANNGNAKRDVMHDVAGFAKAEDLSYINLPIAQVPRGTLSAVTDFSIGRMHVVRPAQTGRLPYVHKNAFYDVAANFKLSNSVAEETPSGRIYYTPNSYSYHERNGQFSVVDPFGVVVAKAGSAKEAESIALSDFETRAQSVYQKQAESLFNHLNATKLKLSNMADVSAGVAALVEGMPKEAVLDVPFDVFGTNLARAFDNKGIDGLVSYLRDFAMIEPVRYETHKGESYPVYELPNIRKYRADGQVERALYTANAKAPEGDFKTAVYLEMITRASNSGTNGIAALAVYHSSIRQGIYRDGFFDEAMFRRYEDGSVEPVAWGSPAIRRTNKSEMKIGDGPDIIDLVKFAGYDIDGNLNPNIPVSLGLGKGKVAIHQHNVMMWVHDWLLTNPEGVAFANKNGISAEEIRAFGQAYVQAGCKGSALKSNKTAKNIHDRIYEAIRLSPDKLVDKINRIQTTRLIQEYQKQGYGLLVMPQIGSSAWEDSIVVAVLSQNKIETAKDIPTAPTPLSNYAIAGSNVVKNAAGEWVRNTQSPLRMFETVSDLAAGRLGRSLSDYNFREGNKFRFSNESEFAGPELATASNVAFETVLNAITAEAINDNATALESLWKTRNDLSQGNEATFLRIEHAVRLSNELNAMRQAIADANPLLSKEEYEASIGEISKKALTEAEEYRKQHKVFDTMYGMLSRLDDDFIMLLEEGRQFVRSTAPDGDGIVPLVTARLDDILNHSNANDKQLENRANLEAYLSTIAAEIAIQTDGMVELKYVLRKALNWHEPNGFYSDGNIVKKMTDTEEVMRPTFVWTEKAIKEKEAFLAALNLTPQQIEGFSTWRRLIEENPDLVTRVRDANSPEHRANVVFAERLQKLREKSASWYRGYSDKADAAATQRDTLSASVKDYETYENGHFSTVMKKVQEMSVEKVKELNREMFIPVKSDERYAEMLMAIQNLAAEGMLMESLKNHLALHESHQKIKEIIERMKSDGRSAEAQNLFILTWLKSTTGDELKKFNIKDVYESSFLKEAEPYIKDLKKLTSNQNFNMSHLEEFLKVSQIWKSKIVEFKDINLLGAFRSGLNDAIADAVAKFPTGITAQNLIKELERANSSGIPVTEEARVTGFMDFLKEKAALPRDPVTGKLPKLDLQEVRAYLDANKLELVLGKDVAFDLDAASLVNKWILKPAGGTSEKTGGGNIIVRATNQRYFPSQGRGTHVRGTPAGGKDTFGWVRYTDRLTSDGKRFLFVEESQAQNNGSLKQALDVQEGVMSEWEKELQSPAGIAALEQFRELLKGNTEDVTSGELNRVLGDFMLKNFGRHNSMIGRDYLSDMLTSISNEFADTPQNVAKLNMILRPNLEMLNRSADAVSRVSEFMLRSASGQAVVDFFGGTLLNEVLMDKAYMRKIAGNIDKHAALSRVSVMPDGDIEVRSIGDFIGPSLERIPVLVPGTEADTVGKANYTTIQQSWPKAHKFLDFIANKAMMPGTAEGIMQIYLQEHAKRLKRNAMAIWDWSMEFEQMLNDDAVKKRIDEYVSDRVAEKSYTDTDDSGRPVTIRFSSKRGVIAAYRDIFGKLTKDTNTANIPAELSSGHFFPEMVREAVKIQHSYRRDKAILKITTDALSSANIRQFLASDLSFVYSNQDWPTMTSNDVSVHSTLVRLLRGTNGTSNTGPYTKLFEKFETVTEHSKRRGFDYSKEDWLDVRKELTMPYESPNGEEISAIVPSFWSGPSSGTAARAIANTTFAQGDSTFRPSYVYHTHMVDSIFKQNPALQAVFDGLEVGKKMTVDLGIPFGGVGEARQKFVIRKVAGEAYTPMSAIETTGKRAFGKELMIDGRAIFEDSMQTLSNRTAFLANVETEIRAARNEDTSTKAALEGLRLLEKMSPFALQKFIEARESLFYNQRPFEDYQINEERSSWNSNMGEVLSKIAAAARQGSDASTLAKLIRQEIISEDQAKAHKQLQVVPFLESKEYFTLLGKAALMFALRQNYDGIAVLAPADGASNSNLSYTKGLDIYGNFLPQFWGKAFKKAGFDLRPSAPLVYKTIFEPQYEASLRTSIKDLHESRLKQLGKMVVLKTDKENGNTYNLRPEYLIAIAQLTHGLELLSPQAPPNGMVMKSSYGSPLINPNSPLTLESLTRDFRNRQLEAEKSTSAGNNVEVERSGESVSKVATVNKDPAGDVYAAFLIRMLDFPATYSSERTKTINDNRAHAQRTAIQKMIVPWFRMIMSNDWRRPIPAGGVFYDFSNFNSDLTVIGIQSKIETLSQSIREVAAAGHLTPENEAKVNEMVEYMKTAMSEIQKHHEMSMGFLVSDWSKQRTVTGGAMLESLGVTPEIHGAAGTPSNRTDIYLRGALLDLTKTPDEVKKKANDEGVYMLKPSSDQEPGGSMVGPTTKAFKGGFISTMASVFSGITNKVRLYVSEEGKGDGSALVAKLYPRGQDDLSQESRHVEVKAVTTPSTRKATIITVVGDDEGKYVRLAKAELDTRLRGLGYSVVTDDGWSAKSLPYEGPLRKIPFGPTNIVSDFSNKTPEGQRAYDTLGKAGGKLFFGRISDKPITEIIDGNPTFQTLSTYRIALKNKDKSIGMHVDVEVSPSVANKVTAKVVGSGYENFKFTFDDESPEKATQYTVPEERAEYSRNYPKNPKELKKLMLEELTNRLADMGVDDVEGLDGFAPKQVEPVKNPISMGQYDSAPEAQQPRQPVARIQPQSQVAFKPTQPAVQSARSWIPGREGNVYTITSTDGYFIAFKNKKYRLYSPAKVIIGIYEEEDEAKRKAEAHARRKKQ